MRKFADGWLGRVRIGTSMTVLMYVLPSILRKLKTKYPQLEISLKAGLTTATLQSLKSGALDLGLCALPIEDSGFDIVPLFADELIAILPEALGPVPKKATPAYLAKCPLILGNRASALRSAAASWLSLAGPVPKPVMEFDNVEAIKSVVAVGLGASIVPSLSLGPGHAATSKTLVLPLSPRLSRQIALVKLSGKRNTQAMELVSTALLGLRGKTFAPQ
jgi:DNA-binding transcriptional LysR family regulator